MWRTTVRPAVGRPFGIALLSVLIIIGGALDIIAGIVTISLRGDGVLLVALEGTEDEVTALGIGFIVVGVLAIVVGTVLWNGRPFARTLVGTVVLARLIATIRSFAALDRESSPQHGYNQPCRRTKEKRAVGNGEHDAPELGARSSQPRAGAALNLVILSGYVSLLVVHSELSTPSSDAACRRRSRRRRVGLNDIDCVGTVIGSVDLTGARTMTAVTTCGSRGSRCCTGIGASMGDYVDPRQGARWRYDGGWARTHCDGLGSCTHGGGASLTLRAAPASAAPPNDPLLTGFVIEGGGGLENVVEGPDCNMWFTAPGAGAIGRLDVLDRRTLFPLPDESAAPIGLTVGPDGALWFTELSANKIGRITTSGAISEYTIPTADSAPVGITTGPDGALWFTESSTNKIGRLTVDGAFTETTLPTAGSEPTNITAGSDGALWFTQFAGNSIGRITVTGAVTEFAVPTPNAQPTGIASGPGRADPVHRATRQPDCALTLTGTFTDTRCRRRLVSFWIASGPGGLSYTASEVNGVGPDVSFVANINTDGAVAELPVRAADCAAGADHLSRRRHLGGHGRPRPRPLAV